MGGNNQAPSGQPPMSGNPNPMMNRQNSYTGNNNPRNNSGGRGGNNYGGPNGGGYGGDNRDF